MALRALALVVATIAACGMFGPQARPIAMPSFEQPQAGEGWRLLGSTLHGDPRSASVADETEAYEQAWADLALAHPPPPVDFDAELVVLFGYPVSTRCPSLRFDGVTFGPALVHGDWSTLGELLTGRKPSCASEERAYSFVVALERTRLPGGEFTLRLDQRCLGDACDPEEEIEVDPL